MERFLSQISGRGCQGDRRGRRKHRTCAQGVGEVRCGLASNPRQPIALSPCHVDKSAIMTAERSRSRTGGGRPFKVLAELHEHRAPFLARWPETAAGFRLRRGFDHDPAPVSPHNALFPSYKTARVHQASWWRVVNRLPTLTRDWSAPLGVDRYEAVQLAICRACSSSKLTGLLYPSAEWRRLAL